MLIDNVDDWLALHQYMIMIFCKLCSNFSSHHVVRGSFSVDIIAAEILDPDQFCQAIIGHGIDCAE